MSIPPVGGKSAHLTSQLREARTDRRDLPADLVPVEGGEPMPAEEPAPEDPRGSGGPCR